ncbi:MAG: hypothetical protein ACNS64_03800 [Candidatus Halalkalibacterium sp. M3_1C_030]
MKKISLTFFLVTVLLLVSSVGYAQLRENQNTSSDFLGGIVKERTAEPGNLGNLFNMTMDHSYSMTFGSVGGQYQNLNAYTNTMHFFFSDRMTGRVDLSVLHSPFGNSYLNGNGGSGEVDFIIRNAELNYQLSEKSNISISFQQVPAYSRYGYYNNRYNPFYNSFYDSNN